MSKQVIVTTSWDDGHPSDHRIAEALAKRGLNGTFYVPFQHEGHHVLRAEEIKSIRRGGFEIGGHTVSHALLTSLAPTEIQTEVRGCKTLLEDLLGEEVTSFCYPRGRHNILIKEQLREAGYIGARTTRMLFTEIVSDSFAMPTSLQAYPHSVSTYVKNSFKAGNCSGLLNFALRLRHRNDWSALGRQLFDRTLEHGGVWHLYGHSWEIDRLDLWKELFDLLDYVAQRNNVKYASNGDLWALYSRRNGRHSSESSS